MQKCLVKTTDHIPQEEKKSNIFQFAFSLLLETILWIFNNFLPNLANSRVLKQYVDRSLAYVPLLLTVLLQYTLHYKATLYLTTLYIKTLHYTLHFTKLHYTALYSTRYSKLHHTLHYSKLHYSTLHCSTLL